MTAWTINSDSALSRFIGDMRELYSANKYVKVSARTGKARSNDQNAIGHAWYEQIANELREDDAMGWKCYCKLHHGIPILRFEDEEFRELYDSTVKGMSYEQKLKIMRILPVTSLMTKKQKSSYLEQLQADFRARGVFLEFQKGD